MAGRPTDYRPEYCEDIIAFCSGGESLTAWCAKQGISRNTLYEWRDRHPTFADAIARARVVACAWWENQVRTNLGDRNFNTRSAEFIMGNQFREEYGPQTQRIELTGAGGGPIQLSKVSDADLLRLAGPILEAEILPSAQIPASTDQSADEKSSKISQTDENPAV